MPLLSRHTAFILCIAFLASLAAAPSWGKTAGDARKKYKSIQKDIKSRESRLKQVERLEAATLDELHKISRQLVEVERELEKYRAALGKTQRDIDAVKADVETLERKVAMRRDFIKRRLRAMHRFDRYGDALLVLGGSEDLPQLLRRWRYLKSLTIYEQEAIRGYQKDLSLLRQRQADLARLERRLKEEQAGVLRREKGLTAKKSEKQNILASLRNEKAAQERFLRDLRKASARMEKLIRQSEKRASYSGSGFRKYKGSLPWPVLGTVAVPYGTQKDPRFNTTVFRNGIYIDADGSAVARAVHNGKVVFADWFRGYGQLVIVNHGGGYHSLYGNLAEIFLKTGDIIERDVEVGRVGTSGLLARPSLYFEIRYKGKPLNPSQWLKRR